MRLFLLMALLLLPALAQGHAPRYLIVIREVQGPPGNQADPALPVARRVFEEELRRRPEVTLDRADLPPPGPELTQTLQRRGLKAYQLTLRLLNVTRALHPPPPGKQYRVLERGVRLTVVGTTWPDDQLAVGGDGESTVQADVGASINPQKEQELLTDALRDAIAQAVQQAIQKLDKGGLVPPQERLRRRRQGPPG